MLQGDTPLIDAARHGRAAGVAALLADGADVNEPKTDGSGATALYVACQEGRTEVVTKLLLPCAKARTRLEGRFAIKSPRATGRSRPWRWRARWLGRNFGA